MNISNTYTLIKIYLISCIQKDFLKTGSSLPALTTSPPSTAQRSNSSPKKKPPSQTNQPSTSMHTKARRTTLSRKKTRKCTLLCSKIKSSALTTSTYWMKYTTMMRTTARLLSKTMNCLVKTQIRAPLIRSFLCWTLARRRRRAKREFLRRTRRRWMHPNHWQH